MLHRYKILMVTRLISSAIGIAIALAVLCLHNTFVFPIVVGVVSLMLVFEFFKVNGLLKYHISTAAALIYSLALPSFTIGLIARFRMIITVVCAAVLMLDYIRCQTKMSARSFFSMLGAALLIPASMSCAVTLNNSHEYHGLAYLVLALGGAWFADTGAYFVGSAFGRTKLCPVISPKKTVEGFIGGILFDVAFFILFNLGYSMISSAKGMEFSVYWFSSIILAMVCAILGTVGDLAASVLKRQLEIKDFSHIMPGHGGLLDRFDSVLLVLPFFTAYIQSVSYFALK